MRIVQHRQFLMYYWVWFEDMCRVFNRQVFGWGPRGIPIGFVTYFTYLGRSDDTDESKDNWLRLVLLPPLLRLPNNRGDWLSDTLGAYTVFLLLFELNVDLFVIEKHDGIVMSRLIHLSVPTILLSSQYQYPL